MISCQKATQLMSLSMERKLSFKEAASLKLHLMICEFCMRFQKQVGSLQKLLRSYRPLGEKKLSPAVKTQIKEQLKNIP